VSVLSSSAFAEPPPAIALGGAAVTSAGRTIAIRLVCHSAASAGTVTLTTRLHARGSARAGACAAPAHDPARPASFALAAGAHGTVRVRLSRAGIHLLAHARRRPVLATLSIALRGRGPISQTVRIR
jgi:hypothetical protein